MSPKSDKKTLSGHSVCIKSLVLTSSLNIVIAFNCHERTTVIKVLLSNKTKALLRNRYGYMHLTFAMCRVYIVGEQRRTKSLKCLYFEISKHEELKINNISTVFV